MGLREIALEAKQFSRTQHSGVLSTHSTSMQGYPFGSVVPFFLTPQGDAIIYISNIALHTRNIKADPKVSLTIYDAGQDDSQANGRVTILGDAEMIDASEVSAQYLALFPQAKAYEQTHDFNFYIIRTQRVRFIGGFGKIHWIEKALWKVERQDWHSASEGMITHMNEDHVDAMELILRAQFNIDPTNVKMLSVFPEGAHYLSNEIVYFVPFDHVCESGMDVRKALVQQTNQARDQLGIKKAS